MWFSPEEEAVCTFQCSHCWGNYRKQEQGGFELHIPNTNSVPGLNGTRIPHLFHDATIRSHWYSSTSIQSNHKTRFSVCLRESQAPGGDSQKGVDAPRQRTGEIYNATSLPEVELPECRLHVTVLSYTKEEGHSWCIIPGLWLITKQSFSLKSSNINSGTYYQSFFPSESLHLVLPHSSQIPCVYISIMLVYHSYFSFQSFCYCWAFHLFPDSSLPYHNNDAIKFLHMDCCILVFYFYGQLSRSWAI